MGHFDVESPRSKPKPLNWGKTFGQNGEIFGIKPITLVAITVALCQGMNHIAELPISYLYKDDFGLGPVQVSFIVCLTSLPWLIKPVWGIISDNVTFFGYRRKSYLIFWGLLECFLYYSVATWATQEWTGVCLLMLIQVCLAFNNVIGEALLVESSQEVQTNEFVSEEQKQAEASKNVSLFFGVKYMGVLATAYLGGLLLNYVDKRSIFMFAGLLPLFVAFAGAFIMNEKKRSKNEIVKDHKSVEYHDLPDISKEDVGTVLNCLEDQCFFIEEGGEELRSELNFQVDSSMTNFRIIADFVKKPVILRPIVFLLLFMITPSCSSTMFYFYTNELKFSPDFMGQLRFANSIASILGVYTFNKYLKNISFQKLLYWSTIICVVLGSTQVILVLRLNSYLGIPDKVFSIGDSIIIQTFAEINYLPILVLACRICPKNIEGTMYALLMSTVNLGAMMSNQIGGALAYMLGITDTNFDNLWILICIANFSMLAPLPFLRTIHFESAMEESQQGPCFKPKHKSKIQIPEEEDCPI